MSSLKAKSLSPPRSLDVPPSSLRGSWNDLSKGVKNFSLKELKDFLTAQSSQSQLYPLPMETVQPKPLTREELKSVVIPPSEIKRKFSIQEEKETFTFCKCSDRMKAYKNLFGACVSFICCFGSFLGILSLQSSINSVAGLGLASSAIVYATLIIVSVLGPSFVKLTGSKYALITGYVLFLLYTLCNYYPSWYTLIPGAILNGIGQPPIWIAIFAHVITVAVRYAPALKETTGNAIALFAGAVAVSIKIGQIVGSLISSFILINVDDINHLSNTTANQSISDDVCVSYTGPPIEPGPIYYTLISTYVLVGIIGISIAVLFMDHLGTEQTFTSPKVVVQKYLCSYSLVVLKTLVNWRMMLLFPMIILNGSKLGFITGIFPKEYVLDCVGIQWIGFGLVAYGIGGIITAYAAGRIVKYLPQFIIVYCAYTVSLGLLLLLLFWEKVPSLLFVFGFNFAWGMAESTYNSVSPGLLGQWFQGEQKEAALGLLQVGIAIGFINSFIGGIYLPLTIQLWILVGIIILSAVTYSIVYFIDNHTKTTLLPCCYREDKEDTNGEEDGEIPNVEMTDTNGTISAVTIPSIEITQY